MCRRPVASRARCPCNAYATRHGCSLDTQNADFSYTIVHCLASYLAPIGEAELCTSTTTCRDSLYRYANSPVQAFEHTSTNVAAAQMRNALTALAETVEDPDQKKVRHHLHRPYGTFVMTPSTLIPSSLDSSLRRRWTTSSLSSVATSTTRLKATPCKHISSEPNRFLPRACAQDKTLTMLGHTETGTGSSLRPRIRSSTMRSLPTLTPWNSSTSLPS
jgi:hypothetical protein